MPKCQECREFFTTVSLLILHLKLKHNFNSQSVYKCLEKGCARSFQYLNSFKKHVRSKHMLVEVQNANVPSIATVNDDTTASSNLSTPST